MIGVSIVMTCVVALGFLGVLPADALQRYEEDVFSTSAGDLKITFLGHGSLMFTFGGKVIYVDPYSSVADYSSLPKADGILITHEHQDHLDNAALDKIITAKTEIILNSAAAAILGKGKILKNGESSLIIGIPVDAVPAYNIVNKRDNGQPFHPKGSGNGYILTFGGTKVYIAGDTENIPEMKGLKDIAIAFLPMNIPFTMTPEMAAETALAFKPKVLYPYHFGKSDTEELTDLLSGSGIDVRIRKMGR